MNAQTRVTASSVVEMSPAGEVMIPEDVRRAGGLVPGRDVTVGLNDRGEVVVLRLAEQETRDERLARVRATIESVAGTVKTGFGSTDAYMDFIRPWRNDPL
ncbi:MAG TPA: AbrB/MazE/SpoVT family DNA-binding domain-containing protein [Sphingomonas sp.]|jgi:bifunctional DNA-binding transcriptional regulator/antitoxin component of YhaV-PrlF toxin-antitoxin module